MQVRIELGSAPIVAAPAARGNGESEIARRAFRHVRLAARLTSFDEALMTPCRRCWGTRAARVFMSPCGRPRYWALGALGLAPEVKPCAGRHDPGVLISQVSQGCVRCRCLPSLPLRSSARRMAAGLRKFRHCPACSPMAQRAKAVARAKALALRVLAERLEHGEPIDELDGLFEAA
jgi:hypothetical protein